VANQIPSLMCLLILDMADHRLPLFGLMLEAKLLPSGLQAPREPIRFLKAHKRALQIPERIVLIARRTLGRSPPTGRFDPKAKLLIQGTYELGLSAASQARSGQGSHQLYLDVASHHLTRRQNTIV
jgi:hypothetical protein